MKRITIWDMDFYYKKSFSPNPKAMKISSYHQQIGNLVNFVTEKYHINMLFDELYIIKEKRSTPRPAGNLIDDKRSRLIGSDFRYDDQKWEINEIIAACRPDYLLYPKVEDNAYYNADIVQFYHKEKRLELKQPFENALKGRKKTLVIDKNFWISDKKNILLCLEELKEYKNIAFLEPIQLKNILEDKDIRKNFLELKFSQGTIFKFQNNYGSEFEDFINLCDFIKDLKEIAPQVRISAIPFRTILTDHWHDDIYIASQNGLQDLERCLKIMDYAKEHRIHIVLVQPNRHLMETPFWYYFEILEYWTRSMEKLSYIELMLWSACKRFNISWNIILSDTEKWSLPHIHFLLALMTQRKDIIDNYGYRKWGDKFLDDSLINWEIINKYRGEYKNE